MRQNRSMELTDGVVVLRPFVEADVFAVAAACDDPEMARFLPHWPEPYTEDEARRYIALTREWNASEDRRVLAVVDASGGDLLGSIDVRIGDVGSVGYWIAAPARGRGLATRALRLVARWALEERRVERLELTTHPENVASQRVAEKAGFVREGVLRSHMRFREGRRDSVLYSLLMSDLEPGA